MKLRVSLVVICFASLVFSTGAQGQTPKKEIQKSESIQPISTAHLKSAITMVKSSGLSRSLELIIPQFLEKARRVFTQMRPEISGEIDEVIKEIRPKLREQQREILEIAGKSVAQKLNAQDLKKLNAFFISDVGQKFVRVQPVILEHMFREVDAYSPKVNDFILENIRLGLKKRSIAF